MTKALLAGDGTELARDVRVAKAATGRTRGLRGTVSLEEGSGLAIEGRSAAQLHTFGMRYPIDAVFCDDRMRVLHVVEGLAPRRVTRWVRGARLAVELPAGTLGGRVAKGDVLSWGEPRPIP